MEGGSNHKGIGVDADDVDYDVEDNSSEGNSQISATERLASR